MSTPEDRNDDDTEAVAERLVRQAPVPRSAFRDQLAGRVSTAAVRLRIHDRPKHLWPLILLFGLGGGLLLGVAALSV